MMRALREEDRLNKRREKVQRRRLEALLDAVPP